MEKEVSRRFREVSDQIAALENVAEARRKVFELEARRIGERVNRDLITQLDTNTDQVGAVSASLQFLRSDLKRLRRLVRELQLGAPGASAQESRSTSSETAPQSAAVNSDVEAADISALEPSMPSAAPTVVVSAPNIEHISEVEGLAEGDPDRLQGLGERAPILWPTAEIGLPARNGHSALEPESVGPEHSMQDVDCRQDCASRVEAGNGVAMFPEDAERPGNTDASLNGAAETAPILKAGPMSKVIEIGGARR